VRHGGWLALALAACVEKTPAPEARPAPLDAYAQPTTLVVPADAAPWRPDAYQPMTVAPTRCLERGVDGKVTVAPNTVTYCQRERTCVVWDRKTGAARIEGKFDVELEPDAVVGTAATPKPVEDTQISFPGDRVELCPPNRACFQFRPDQRHGVTVERVGLSPDASLASVVLAGEGGANARVEIWSVETERRVAQIPVPRVARDELLRSELVPGAIIIYRIDADEYAYATLYGLDGRKRAELGEGSGLLDYDYVFMLDGRRVAVFDWGAEGAPYRLLVQDVRTGAVLARYTIPAGDARPDVDRFDEAILVMAQWSTELRIDLVDARPTRGIHEVLVAPGC
jgi:hypothetical protein